jgi:catechol 2,3-dioxygenase-like lactoylglutathione lyase family enzyme
MPVGGEDTARAFFGELLGLREIPKPDDGNRMDGCWFDLGGGMQLHLLVDENFKAAKRAHPAFCVANLEDYRLRLKQGGGSVTDFKPSEGRERFFCEDPFGNRLEFISPRKNP